MQQLRGRRSSDDAWARAAPCGVRRRLGGPRVRPPLRPPPLRPQARRHGGPRRHSVMCRLPLVCQGSGMGAPPRGEDLHRMPLLWLQLSQGHHHELPKGTTRVHLYR